MATISDIIIRLSNGTKVAIIPSAELTPPDGQLVTQSAQWSDGIDPTQYLQDVVMQLAGQAAGKPYTGNYRLVGVGGPGFQKVRLDPA